MDPGRRRPGEHELVAELVAEGITPERAGAQFRHARTGEMVTVLDVARDHFCGYGSLNDPLDEAGVPRVKGIRPSFLFRRRPGA